MLVRLLHPAKHASSKEVIPFGKVMQVRLLQSENHPRPKEVIPSGKVMLVRLLQPLYLLLVDYQYYTL